MTWNGQKIVISEVSTTFTAVDRNANPVAYQMETATTRVKFQINNAKLYVPIVMLSIEDNFEFLDVTK